MSQKRALDKQGSLGSLLYADRSASPREQDWVRLVEAIAAGDQRALRDLYERAHRIVFTLHMRICANREIAEELTMDVFHDIWRRSAQYNPENGTVVGWIMNQARSRAIDRLRFEQRQKRRPPDGHAAAPDEAPADMLETRRRKAVLDRALAELTADERRAVETAFFKDKTYEETAAALDAPVGTVKTRMRSALAKLRKALDGASQ